MWLGNTASATWLAISHATGSAPPEIQRTALLTSSAVFDLTTVDGESSPKIGDYALEYTCGSIATAGPESDAEVTPLPSPPAPLPSPPTPLPSVSTPSRRGLTPDPVAVCSYAICIVHFCPLFLTRWPPPPPASRPRPPPRQVDVYVASPLAASAELAGLTLDMGGWGTLDLGAAA
eukprot:161848-Pyramimonas_sp.AAC.1